MKTSILISTLITLSLFHSMVSIKMCDPIKPGQKKMCKKWAQKEKGAGAKNNFTCVKKWWLLFFEGGKCEVDYDELENLAAQDQAHGYSSSTLLLAFGFGSSIGALGYLLIKRKNDVKSLENKYLVQMN